jgi:hypothetical protein
MRGTWLRNKRNNKRMEVILVRQAGRLPENQLYAGRFPQDFLPCKGSKEKESEISGART